MGIFIDSFSVTPQDITSARVALTVNYKGYVDSNTDNPVTITLTLETGTNAYIAENTTDEKKTITWTDNFPVTNSGQLSKNLYVGVDPSDPGKTCTVGASFTPKSGNADNEQTHFNLQ
jgi:hypothetical protein